MVVLSCPVFGSGVIQDRKNIDLVSESLLKMFDKGVSTLDWLVCISKHAHRGAICQGICYL